MGGDGAAPLRTPRSRIRCGGSADCERDLRSGAWPGSGAGICGHHYRGDSAASPTNDPVPQRQTSGAFGGCRHRSLLEVAASVMITMHATCASSILGPHSPPPKYLGLPVVQVSPHNCPPPSTVSVSPVTNRPDGPARYTQASAMSQGEPARIIGLERG